MRGPVTSKEDLHVGDGSPPHCNRYKLKPECRRIGTFDQAILHGHLHQLWLGRILERKAESAGLCGNSIVIFGNQQTRGQADWHLRRRDLDHGGAKLHIRLHSTTSEPFGYNMALASAEVDLDLHSLVLVVNDVID